METVLRFNDGKQKIILLPDYEVTDHADINITIENVKVGDPDNPDYAYVTLKEHEAVFLAQEILRFVEINRKDNVRWSEEQEKKNER